MSFWIELHCDSQSAGPDPCGGPSCLSMNGNSPGHLMLNATSLSRGASLLIQEVRTAGWKFTRQGWVCPACVKERGL